jgi:hypothetical protein
MFLDQKLKDIQEAKNRLAVSCDLRRSLIHMEVADVRGGARRTLMALTLGITLAEQIIGLLRERKGSRR